MLIFFTFVFLYKNHCQSSMCVIFEFFIITNHSHCQFNFRFILFDLIMQIKYKKKSCFSKIECKNISIFFPHHLNVVKMNLNEFLGLMLFFNIYDK